MRTFRNLFKYISKYKVYLVLMFVFAVLSTLFSIISFAFFIPVFEILFKTKDMVMVPPEPLSFSNLSTNAIKENFYYFLNEIISKYSPQTALLYVVIIIIIVFFFKDIFRYLTSYCISPIRQGVIKELRNELFHQILILPLSFYSHRKKETSSHA